LLTWNDRILVAKSVKPLKHDRCAAGIDTPFPAGVTITPMGGSSLKAKKAVAVALKWRYWEWAFGRSECRSFDCRKEEAPGKSPVNSSESKKGKPNSVFEIVFR
jgi:hypothetical protein